MLKGSGENKMKYRKSPASGYGNKFMSEEGCSCHVSPPCSYCLNRCECAGCEKSDYQDDMHEIHGDLFCEECFNIKVGN